MRQFPGSNFASSYHKYVNRFHEINEAARGSPGRTDPSGKGAYLSAVKEVARDIFFFKNNCKLLCLPGLPAAEHHHSPYFSRAAERKGVSAIQISLDDFFMGDGKAPILDSGEYDYGYQGVKLRTGGKLPFRLVQSGLLQKPTFDFEKKQPMPDVTEIQLPPGGTQS